MTEIFVILAGIGLLSLLCQWISWWVKLPAILFLLLTGILIGPGLHWLHPDVLFGKLLTPIISFAVAIILFEGSLTLNFDEMHGLGSVIRNLLTLGLVITWLATAFFTHLIFHFPWELSILLGAITAVTGPTVITPLLRTVRPNSHIANILRWEGIMIDPIGALLAVLVFGFIVSYRGNDIISSIVYHFTEMILIGSAVGVCFGYFLGIAIRRHWLPEFLHNVATLTLVLTAFTLADRLHEGSGLLAVTIMGIWLANMRHVPVDEILGFKESLSILLISGLFIILAAQTNFSHFVGILFPVLILLLTIQFIIRPLSIFLCTLGSTLKWNERALLGWIAPRGIVAAAVSALFAIRLQKGHLEGAHLLMMLTFSIIVGTVIFQSVTARWIAQLLGVADPEPKGFLIIGANPVARHIAKALAEKGFRVLLTGINWESVREARMEGLETYFGNPISEHADRHINLVGIGKMLALSPQGDLNALAGLRYRSEFGRKAIYSLQTQHIGKKVMLEKYIVSPKHAGAALFGHDITYSKLASLIAQGATIRSTQLTEAFDFNAYHEQYGKNAIPLFALDTKDRLHVFTVEETPAVSAGWTIISLTLVE